MSIENIKKFSNKLSQTMNFVVNETVDILGTNEFKKKAVDLNKLQIDGGIGSDNAKFGDYTYPSKVLKEAKGQFTGYINLTDTGAFKGSIYATTTKVSAKEPAIALGATDSKWEEELKPQKRFTMAIGLTKENADEIGGMLAPILAQRISKFWRI